MRILDETTTRKTMVEKVVNDMPQLSSDATTRKKMIKEKSHQNRLKFQKKLQKNLGSARFN